MKEVKLNLTEEEIKILYTILTCYGDGAPVREEESNLRDKIMKGLGKYM